MTRIENFLNSIGLMEAFVADIDNIGNDEVKDIFEGIADGEYSEVVVLNDEWWLQWDSSASGTNWEEVSELYETFLETGELSLDKYNLILGDDEELNELGVNKYRVIEYAKNRLLSNEEDYLDMLDDDALSKLFVSVGASIEKEEEVEDTLMRIAEEDEALTASLMKSVEVEIRAFVITIEKAIEIIESYDETVEEVK